MRKITEDKEFTIHITYTAKELSEIVRWYMLNEMPPIYNNYDFNNEDIANMIEDEAVKTLLDIGSNQLMGDYFCLLYTSDAADE